MYLYYGSPAYFRDFSNCFNFTCRITNDTTTGVGIHFTTKESIAQENAAKDGKEGYVYRCVFNENLARPLPKKLNLEFVRMVLNGVYIGSKNNNVELEFLFNLCSLFGTSPNEFQDVTSLLDMVARGLMKKYHSTIEFQTILCRMASPIVVLTYLCNAGWHYHATMPKYGNHTIYTLYNPALAGIEAIRSTNEVFTDRNILQEVRHA